MSRYDKESIKDNKSNHAPVNRYGHPITVRSRIFTIAILIAIFFFVFLGITRYMPSESFITAIVAGVILLLFAVIIFFLMQDGKKRHNSKYDDLD